MRFTHLLIIISFTSSLSSAYPIVDQSPVSGGGVSRWSQLWQDPGPNGNDLNGDAVSWADFTLTQPSSIDHLEWWGTGACELGFRIEFWKQDPGTIAYQPYGVFYYGGDHTKQADAKFDTTAFTVDAGPGGIDHYSLDLATPVSLAANTTINPRWFVDIIGLTHQAYVTWNWSQGVGTGRTYQFVRGEGPQFRPLGEGRALVVGVTPEPSAAILLIIALAMQCVCRRGFRRTQPVIVRAKSSFSFAMLGLCLTMMASLANAGVVVTPTMNPGDLENAIGGSGMTIDSVNIINGASGQYGTYTNYTAEPITIGDGVILSTGDVSFVTPPADPSLDSPQPSYDMATPGTPEFDAFGPGHIDNFQSSNDVAVLEVNFSLDDDSQIQFDFVFGSVEYPFYTSSFTDSFLVFLDDTSTQITFDQNGAPVQVGTSFAGLVATSDQNTAFANPHGVLGLTTTTAVLGDGEHTLRFEIGDVNDHILDSAVFIANLRTGIGDEGTEITDPEDYVPEPGPLSLAIIGGCLVIWARRK